MNDKLKIAFLSPYLPAVDTTACARKIYDCVRLLHQRGHKIYLLSFCNKKEIAKIKAVNSYCTELCLDYIEDYSRYPVRSTILTDKIRTLCKGKVVNLLQCENSFMARYLPKDINIASVLTEHEVLSSSFYDRARLENNHFTRITLHARSIKKLWEQKKWYRGFNKIVVFSQEDKDIIAKLYGKKNIDVIPLGVNLRDYPSRQSEKRHYDIIFVGNFSHWPNVDAVLYFNKDILPLIKKKFPDISVIFVGANPPDTIKRLAKLSRNIQVSGYIKDVRESYYNSKIFIAPIRYGRGMRFKILEAWALRMAVVSTSCGARGLILNDNIKIADSQRDFADKVIELLNNQNMREDLAKNGRLTVEKYYDWDILLNKYENIYYDLLNKE